jgi:hypothetical protein
MAIIMVKSPSPALQSETSTFNVAEVQDVMVELLRSIAQIFSCKAPQPLEAGVLVAVGAVVGVWVAVGPPGVLVWVGVAVGLVLQATYSQVMLDMTPRVW